MDFITRKFQKKLSIADPGSADKRALLQARIEYLFYFMLGYLWNKKRDVLSADDLTRFVGTLKGSLTIGRMIWSLKTFDKEKELLGQNQAEAILKDYKAYRDQYIGHGYTFGDTIAASEQILEDLYHDLVAAVPLLQKDMDLVVVWGLADDSYYGRIYRTDEKGEADRWECPQQLIEQPVGYPQVYCRVDGNYFQISPFVLVEEDEAQVFVFHEVEQKLTGKTAYTQLFKTGKVTRMVQDFVDISITEEHRVISSNQTIMNRFETNYRTYFDVSVTKTVRRFVLDNDAYISAVLWGNGGVGKTACAQKICRDLFEDDVRRFEYIVFVTAKDRRFNEITGMIENFDNPQSYHGVISTIYKTVRGQLLEHPEGSDEFEAVVQSILNLTDDSDRRQPRKALLLVIDDFETFEDTEKKKISDFISRLDIKWHKVIITTRNSRLAEGHLIPTNELNREDTIRFLQDRMQESYPKLQRALTSLLTQPDAQDRIYDATGGVPIFILQWMHLFAQNAGENELMQRFSTRMEAREFLSGRVFATLREDAKMLYAALAPVVSKELTFPVDRLSYVCGKYMTPERFDDAFVELERMCIIEPYQVDEQVRAKSVYRVYTKSFHEDMGDRYQELNEALRDAIRQRLASAGGNTSVLTLHQSLLLEARQSRGTKNETETVSKYRHLINMVGCPYEDKQQAFTELLGFYFSALESPEKGIALMKEYTGVFGNDPIVLYKYIFSLWSVADKSYKDIAFEELTRYFDCTPVLTPAHLKFFSMGLGYYIIYLEDSPDMEQAERAFRLCDLLRDYTTVGDEEPDPAKKKALSNSAHERRVALQHAVRLSANLALHDENYEKKCRELAEYFLDTFADNAHDCEVVRRQLTLLDNMVKMNDATTTASLPEGCELFFPQLLLNNPNGLPQYLNGYVNGTWGGIACFDFAKFGAVQLAEYGGMHALMRLLDQRKRPLPVVITRVSEKGLLTLSAYQTKLSVRQLVEWGSEGGESEPEQEPERELVGEVSAIVTGKRYNKETETYDEIRFRGEITTEDGTVFRMGRAVMDRLPDLVEGARVRFREKSNTHPNAPADIRYADDVIIVE